MRVPRPTVPARDSAAEDDLLARLRRKDEAAFQQLLRHHHMTLIGLAMSYVRNRATAEEIAQETWLAVIEGLDRFDGRSSLKTWIFAILANRARARATRDGRATVFTEMGLDESAVDAERFTAAGGWRDPPRPWDALTPERRVGDAQILALLREALEELPAAQRAVILLRDIEGCGTAEVCNILGISETNHRVLLHRGRAKLRKWMEDRLAPKDQRKDARRA